MPEQDPPAVTVQNEGGSSPVFLLCEHAANHIPARYRNLGLPASALLRHIAYDIGAAAVARRLSAALDAPLVLSGYSRLLIDCNRPLSAPSSIPERSEDTDIPGNVALSPAERADRDARFFAPFRTRVADMLDARLRQRRPTILIGIHSFTPIYLGVPRPWHAGVLYARARTLARAMISALAADAALVVGDNEPYRVTPQADYTVPMQGEARGIATALIEIRQDLIATATGQRAWADRLAGVLTPIVREPAAFAQLAEAAP